MGGLFEISSFYSLNLIEKFFIDGSKFSINQFLPIFRKISRNWSKLKTFTRTLTAAGLDISYTAGDPCEDDLV